MKILFAVSSLSSGGAERVATTLCNGWIQRGYHVTLVPTFSGQSKCFYQLDSNVCLVNLIDLLPKKKKTLITQFKRMLALRRLIVKEKPDVVISFLTNVNIACILATRGLNIPVIISERSNLERHPLPWGMRLQYHITYPWADILTVQTQAASEFFKGKSYAKQIMVIPNPIPPSLPINAALNKQKKSDNRLALVSMGRLGPEKQFDLLLDAFALLVKQNPCWDLRILGEGPQRKLLEQKICQQGLQDRVHLTGRTENPWLIMSECDAFVLTSNYEGFPNALLEAMAIGLPCVSFDCPNGPREMSGDNQDVLLVPANDTDALVATLNRIMNDKGLRELLGRQAALSVLNRYGLDHVLDIWDKLFKTINKQDQLL